MHRIAAFAAFLAGIIAAGCAGNGQVQRETTVYERHAGEPVSQVRLFNVRDWRPVGRNLILLHTSRQEYYLVEPSLGCTGNLRWARTLELEQGAVNTLRPMDTLRLDGERCTIISIRPVDYEQVRAELGQGGT